MADTTKETRIKKFQEDYEALTKKHNIDMASYPMWVPAGPNGEFRTILQTTYVDLKEMAKAAEQKKPFIAQ